MRSPLRFHHLVSSLQVVVSFLWVWPQGPQTSHRFNNRFCWIQRNIHQQFKSLEMSHWRASIRFMYVSNRRSSQWFLRLPHRRCWRFPWSFPNTSCWLFCRRSFRWLHLHLHIQQFSGVFGWLSNQLQWALHPCCVGNLLTKQLRRWFTRRRVEGDHWRERRNKCRSPAGQQEDHCPWPQIQQMSADVRLLPAPKLLPLPPQKEPEDLWGGQEAGDVLLFLTNPEH